MREETKIVKGYAHLVEIMESREGSKKGLWLTCPDKLRYVYLTFDRTPIVNVGLAKHKFDSFSEAINYIVEFLYN